MFEFVWRLPSPLYYIDLCPQCPSTCGPLVPAGPLRLYRRVQRGLLQPLSHPCNSAGVVPPWHPISRWVPHLSGPGPHLLRALVAQFPRGPPSYGEPRTCAAPGLICCVHWLCCCGGGPSPTILRVVVPRSVPGTLCRPHCDRTLGGEGGWPFVPGLVLI